MGGSIFDKARSCIGPAVIESLLPGGRWESGEYWITNPTRNDREAGSFSISESGLWHDFAGGAETGGDLIDLLVLWRGCTKSKAAEDIIHAAGDTVDDIPRKQTAKPKKSDKPKPVIPAPELKHKILNDEAKSRWAVEKYGVPVKGWTYRTADGGIAFCVTRHEKKKPDGKIVKNVVPWYFGTDNRWHVGQAYEHGRPLYRLDLVVKADKSMPVLIVEGEKCADVNVPGYIVTTWPGGSSAVSHADWSPLEGRNVIIWPDADEPGYKAAAAIAKRLPGAKIITVKDRPEKWDIYNAVEEGIDPVSFILENLPKESEKRVGNCGEFIALGHDGVHHWFLRKGVRTPYKIAVGGFTASKIISLAPLAYWSAQNMTNDRDGIKVTLAQDYIESLSYEVGQYRPERIRGAGVWRDKDGYIVNDGTKLIRPSGDVINFDEYQSPHHYISSQVEFGNVIDYAADAEEGAVLAKLFAVQGWINPAQAELAMGWSLIAPFGGVLHWRPHIWITGRRGTGKSWILEHLIAPLCGPFAHRGSGKDSEAGLRRSLDMDARPVIMDEMEPKGQRAAERVSAILDLARNASSDGSGYITMATPDGGTQRFVVRSCFCFGSIQTPDGEGAAIGSRITMLELRTPIDQDAKFRASSALYSECMDDPARFRRRIFRSLGRVQRDIEWLRLEQRAIFGEQRRADQLAPMLAAAWAVRSDESMNCPEGIDWLAMLSPYLGPEADITKDDEEAVIDHLLGAHIRIDGGETRTVSELLHAGYCTDQNWTVAQDALERYGIRVFAGGLAIKAKSDQLRILLKDTPYANGYGAQIRRHRFALDDATRQVRMAGGRAQCYVLDWNQFRAEYLDEHTHLAASLSEDPPF